MTPYGTVLTVNSKKNYKNDYCTSDHIWTLDGKISKQMFLAKSVIFLAFLCSGSDEKCNVSDIDREKKHPVSVYRTVLIVDTQIDWLDWLLDVWFFFIFILILCS